MLIGVDIIEIERIKQVIERTPRFLDRVFTKEERTYCFSKKDPYPSLAVRFAVREAVRKLHPALAVGILFHEVEVKSHEDGRPELILHGNALQRCAEERIEGISISLSHSKTQAIAVVIAAKG